MKRSSAILKRFGKKLREERAKTGISQERLAERTGLSRNYVGSLERGEANPTLLTLDKIGGVLKVESWKFLK